MNIRSKTHLINTLLLGSLLFIGGCQLVDGCIITDPRGSGGEPLGGGSIFGIVVDNEGKPVAAATVKFEVGDPTPQSVSTDTDADGRFTFQAVQRRPAIVMASKAGFSSSSTRATARKNNPAFVVLILIPGNTPPMEGNRRPRVNEMTVNPVEFDTTGKVNFNATVTDNDSANLTAIALISRANRPLSDGVAASAVLTRVGNVSPFFVGASPVPPNVSSSAATHEVIVAVTDAGNGSGEVVQSDTVTLTVNPPLAAPGPPSLSRVNRTKKVEQ